MLHLLELNNVPIFEQLQLEEALLRSDNRNWCVVNVGSSPAIVMGISGKPELLINQEKIQKNPIPVIRRFSGGGTVVVDHHTVFITLICNVAHAQVPCCPNKVLQWTGELYHPAFADCAFRVVENDYVIGDRKFGGNAQYFRKDLWLHHSSLLWDFTKDNMDYLLFPPKVPKYRQNRDHHDFLCTLKDHFSNPKEVKKGLLQALAQRFVLKKVDQTDIMPLLDAPHRKATTIIE